jgi:chemotaxis protein methyltransferase CheR
MTDRELAAFMAVALPRLGLRADGFRRVRGTVRKRLTRRLAGLGLDVHDYGRYLEVHPEEWQWLDACCRITISRFGRDAEVFGELLARRLPEQAAAARADGRARLRMWSAGCASGEEAYAAAIGYRACDAPLQAGLELEVLGTDMEAAVLARAERGGYPVGCLRELPERLRALAFEQRGSEWFVLPPFRAGVRFERGDLRAETPDGPFDVVLCRNVAFTYFAEALQRRVAQALASALRPGGLLVVGAGEVLPEGSLGLVAETPCFYQRVGVG